ncbi:MAG: transglycosylase family protein [Oryzihumus sp.]
MTDRLARLLLIVALVALRPGPAPQPPLRLVLAPVVTTPAPRLVAPRASRSRRTPVPAQLIVPSLLLRIRSCESGGGSGRPDDVDWRAQNPTSSASGGYQVTVGTWAGYGGYARAKDAPAAVQTAFALQLFRQRGSEPWLSSRSCWA